MKTAVVTGGAKGIGAAAVKKLCENGFSTAIIYNTSEEKAFALSSCLVNAGFDCFAVKADISSPKETKEAIAQIIKRNGSIDVLVNNAGIAKQQLFDTIQNSEWQQMINVNLSGTFYCCREVLPVMLRKKSGKIINISSMWGQTGASCEVAYSAAKAGVIGLTKALAKEVAPSGITVNCVAPGCVNTDMMSHFTPDEINDICNDIPLGRLASPEEIAEVIAFFASEAASYITGQVLGVNGGMVI